MTRVARDCLCRDVWGERVLREPLPRCTIRILADQGASLGRWTALAARCCSVFWRHWLENRMEEIHT
jgi:hypothetical protein